MNECFFRSQENPMDTVNAWSWDQAEEAISTHCPVPLRLFQAITGKFERKALVPRPLDGHSYGF